MINSTMIKGRMSEMGINQGDIANALALAKPTVSQKINGIRPMDLDEARKIADLLHIDAGEFGKYFFAQKLHSATQAGNGEHLCRELR